MTASLHSQVRPVAGGSEPRDAAPFLDAAGRIARRLIESALWDGPVCSWVITTNSKLDPWERRTVNEAAGPGLYQGTAGIGLFLAEVAAVLQEPALRRTADGALLHSESLLGQVRATFSFHVGRTGLAYALSRCATLFDSGPCAERTLKLLEPLRGSEHAEPGVDVIGGAAGAIPVLLGLSRSLDAPWLIDSACRLGELLIRQRRQWPLGWSWATPGTVVSRDLTGLAHGAAGIGSAFLELYHATGQSGFRFAAEQAFAYEQESFEADEGNWPDYRNSELSEATSTNARLQRLRAALAEGAARPVYRPHFMVGWCHGAAGIGLTRLRAFEVLGNPAYRAEARLAVEATQKCASTLRNYSLCHGIFGNDETLLLAAQILGEPPLATSATARALHAVEEHELSGTGWPSGATGARPDPSFMLGDAGIGYHLLKLARPALPSILLPLARRVPLDHEGCGHGHSGSVPEVVLRNGSWNAFFGRSERVLQRLHPTLARALADVVATIDPLDLRVVRQAMIDALNAEPSPVLRRLLFDAVRLDDRRFDLFAAPVDFSESVIEDLRRIPLDVLDWDAVVFRLSPFVRIVAEAHDWDAWLESRAGAAPPQELDRNLMHLVCLKHGSAVTKRLSPVAAIVLSACAEPRRFTDVVQYMLERTDGVGVDDLRGFARDQIGKWYIDRAIGADPLKPGA